jgi:hypothetical protein
VLILAGINADDCARLLCALALCEGDHSDLPACARCDCMVNERLLHGEASRAA